MEMSSARGSTGFLFRFFFFSSRRRHTRYWRDWSSDVCSSDLRTRLRDRAHVLWLWVALDPLTKLIPVLQLGARTQPAAHTVVHELRQRLASDCLQIGRAHV